MSLLIALVIVAGTLNLYKHATKELHDRFAIAHDTLQPVGAAFAVPCEGMRTADDGASQYEP